MKTPADSQTRTFDPVRAAAVEALVLIEQGQQSDEAIQQHIRDNGGTVAIWRVPAR